MITMLDQDKNLNKYNILFKDAWKTLLQPDADHPEMTLLKPADIEAANDGKTAFSDLAHYFSYIEELIAIDPIYLMLPIDEAPFEIKANTREIKIPPEFAKCSGVQSDNYSEIVTFTIDRYFDYKDLNEAEIAVQWINEAAGKEGVSFIQLKDLKTYGDENKIRFGWPLTSEMTAAAGNLRFAVRFFTANTDADGKIAFNYIFNTTVASIPIKPTLNVDFNGANTIIKDNDYSLFTSYISNSQNPSYGIPTDVVFVNTEEDLPIEGKISLEDDTLVLKAQAITRDLNNITYDWYRQRGDEIVNLSNPAEGVSYPQYAINNELFEEYPGVDALGEEKPWPAKRPTMTLWKDEGGEKVPYLEAGWPTAKPNFTLYTRKTALTFVSKNGEETPEGYYDIAGIYFVKGTNTTVGGYNSVSKKSDVCNILAPADIVIDSDLSNHMFLDDNTNTLSMSIKEDEANPQRFYNVYYSENVFDENDIATMTPESDGDADLEGNQLMVILDGENNINYPLTAGKFGYYMIQPISKLNRVEKTKASALCKVTDHPKVPEGKMYVQDIEAVKVDADGNGNLDIIVIDDDITAKWKTEDILEIDSDRMGKTIKLQVKVADNFFNTFETETVTYRWFRSLPDSPKVEIFKDDIDENVNERDVWSFNDDGSLTIQVVEPDEGSAYTYTCIVTNTVNTETVESKEYIFVVD